MDPLRAARHIGYDHPTDQLEPGRTLDGFELAQLRRCRDRGRLVLFPVLGWGSYTHRAVNTAEADSPGTHFLVRLQDGGNE